MIRVLALSPALDITYEIEALDRGGINRPLATTAVAGGKSLNMARAARALGADVHAIVALGGLNGERVHRLLEADRVAMTVVELAAETRTCFSLVEADGGATSTDVYEVATGFASEEWASYAATVREAAPTAWTAVSGSVPTGVPGTELALLLAAARTNGTRVALDTSGPELVRLARECDLIKINRVEVSELIGDDVVDAAAGCAALHDLFGVDAVVTDGVNGGAALSAGTLIRLDAPEIVGRFPAGSGDSFFGGLLHGLDSGMTLENALGIARNAAERNARVPGQAVLAAL
ncbi:1-phosphofructokinase family hexose kinase [Microbacterium sp. CCH5-D1]|uniref:1-phosphofructokinase family hexose kinase n=1 Tax=Microbacterium sp. CCH5-D1 TaxID=1768780 RepID=UPI00076A2F01|nr:PfkB family carbohydrate kinase [Microbacterium sp. CCH5-D1]